MTDVADTGTRAAVADATDVPAVVDVAPVADVADHVVDLMRAFTKARTRLLDEFADDVEWSAHLLLRTVRDSGPMRSGAVAELLRSDPSTVSRQVAALVRDGLLERRADPDDGRASLLVLTPKGTNLLAEHDRIRLQHFARMLDGWPDADLRSFAAMLGRFTQAYEAVNSNWITERIASRSGRAGSTN
jgi:DNA-binding MarR family transcriptional regulator